MALPPEPIDELLRAAAWVVEAQVKEIVSVGPPQPKVEAPPDFVDVPQKMSSQVVKLEVKRILRGKAGPEELVVEKPVGAYALRPGVCGPFLLDGSSPRPVILGRYGPDTYSLARVEAALAKSR